MTVGGIQHWRSVNLGEVADLCLGKMLDAKKNKGRLLPYLANPNVRWLEVDTSALKLMRFEVHEDERFGLRAGDVVVCEGGEAGRAAVWDGRIPEMKFQKAIHRIRPKSSLHARFLVYRLMHDYQAGRLEDYYTGATIKHLTGQDLARYRFELPPANEQRRIVAILDEANNLRAKRREALTQLDQLAQSIFVDMFGDPAINAKGWPVTTLGDLLESATYGTSEKSGASGQFPVLRMNNISRTGEMDFSDLKYMDLGATERARYLVRAGDILFNRTNSAYLVGKTAIFRQPEPMAYAGYLIRLRANADNDPEYLAGFMNTPYAKRVLRGMCKSIIGMANINATEVQGIRIARPPLALQTRYRERISSLNHVKASHRTMLAEQDRLFTSLQHRAFLGEL